jgi:hypothetical protein
MAQHENIIRRELREALGPNYSKRLGAVYAVLYDEAGVLSRFAFRGGATACAVRDLATALQVIREKAGLNF